ncbi:hypothetical protein SLEP1_g41939 [Rubroshorea leprosula]|uniref:Uncharacterized protein n=1 Tax=Rubroshorea leprosula TaxID=152421 RepID=A0AAV5L8K9_9ROSI|nr:hypothetical protein SLEP1_g41939 [Rubroshorea leprosula]
MKFKEKKRARRNNPIRWMHAHGEDTCIFTFPRMLCRVCLAKIFKGITTSCSRHARPLACYKMCQINYPLATNIHHITVSNWPPP